MTAQGFDSGEDLLSAMTSVEERQVVGVEALHAHADTVDRERAESLGILLRDVIGVAFDGYLTPARQRVELGDSVEDAGQLLRSEERRSAAAEVDVVYQCAIRELHPPKVKLPDEGIEEVSSETASRLGVEVAVRAATCTEGDMEVEVHATSHQPEA